MHGKCPWCHAEHTSQRDAFATAALTGLLAQTMATESGLPTPAWEGNSEDREGLAKRAWLIADAMLAARDKKGKA